MAQSRRLRKVSEEPVASPGEEQRGTAMVVAMPARQPSQAAEERVRQRAYELYEQRGRVEGHDLEDWLQAEAELRVAEGKLDA